MKKLLPLALAISCLTPAAMAGDLNALQLLNQSEFRTLSEDLGAALSYKSVMPTAPLGILGFDVGVVVSGSDMSRSAALLSKASGGGITESTLYMPKLHVAKGLPFGVDAAAFISRVPTTNIQLVGGELRYALVEGNMLLPAIAVRGAMSKLSGVEQLSLDTKSVDISISKGFLMLTPYAGIGRVWTDSSARNVSTLSAESFSQTKVFAGVNLNLGLANLAFETDKTGQVNTYSAKVGLRF